MNTNMEFLELPVELIEYICTYLDSCSKVQLSKTCIIFDNIISSKKLVRSLNLSEVLNVEVDDLQFIVKNAVRCENISILIIDCFYWMSRQELCRSIKKLSNLTQLYALDTKLQIKDIAYLSKILKQLIVVSFTVADSKLNPADLNLYKVEFQKLSKIYIEFNCTTRPQFIINFFKLTCGDGFQELSPRFEQDLYGHCQIGVDKRLCLYYLFKNIDWPISFMLNHLDLYYKCVQKFLPEFNSSLTTSNSDLYIFPYNTLYSITQNCFQLHDITKLCLYCVKYNFKGKCLGSAFSNVRELYINTKQLYDTINQIHPTQTNSFKKQRLGFSMSADSEEEQPIRTLVAACPKLETLCISENTDIIIESMVWYPNCLRSISLWKNLKHLSLHQIKTRNGEFLQEISENCPNIIYLSLALIGPIHAPSFFLKDLCLSVTKWKKLQYINIEFLQPKVKDLLQTLALCKSLKVIIISINDNISRTKSDITYEDLHRVLYNIESLFVLQIVDSAFSISCSNRLQHTLRQYFSKQRSKLRIYIQQNIVKENIPKFLDMLDIRKWLYWMT